MAGIHQRVMLLVFVFLCVFTQITLAGRYIEVSTTGKLTMERVNDFDVPIAGKQSLTMDIKGCKNAIFLLSKTPYIGTEESSYYLVTLGSQFGEDPPVSSIKDGCIGCPATTEIKKDILSCTSFNTFKVTWNGNGSLEIREGTNMSAKPLLSSSQLRIHGLNYLHVVSPKVNVTWRIYVECAAGKFGDKCVWVCGHCKVGFTCHEDTGQCPGECQLGWRGERCDQVCPNATYGRGCKPCGMCAGETCDTITGKCMNGCIAGWTGDLCQEVCPRNLFGDNCVLTCGHCSCGTCNSTNGVCPYGCQAGWMGFKCDKECVPGFYGQRCKHCDHCIKGTACDKTTGACPTGCDAGWMGDKCNKRCPRGTYGQGCKPCGKCHIGSCNRLNGKCTGRCKVGWKGPMCDKATCPQVSTSTPPRQYPTTNTNTNNTNTKTYTTRAVKTTPTDNGCWCPTMKSTDGIYALQPSPPDLNPNPSLLTSKTKQEEKKMSNHSLHPGYIATIAIGVLFVSLAVFTISITIKWWRYRPQGKPVYFNKKNDNPFESNPYCSNIEQNMSTIHDNATFVINNSDV